jgi:hypothetical protein
VNDNVHYDMSTAQFLSISAAIDQGSNPCASGCTSSSGSWSWNASTVSFSLSAPDCGTHMVSPGGLQLPYQCGEGTHADFVATPTFRVKKRDVQQLEAQASTQTIMLGRKKVSDPVPLPPNWTSVEVRGQFKDGKESVENHARLTSGPAGILSASDPIFWKAEVSGQTFLISTR